MARELPVCREFGGEPDVDALVAMFQASVAVDTDALGNSADDIRFEWVHDEPGWRRTLQIWEVGRQCVAAFGSWYQPGDLTARSYGELEVHPDWREPVFVDEVTQANLQAVSELIDRRVELRIGAAGSQVWKQEGFVRAGFSEDRHFHRMSAILSRELPSPAIADGFTIRPLRGESEVEAWVKAHNGGFSDHYDPPADTAQDKRTAMQSPGYLPEADLVLADSADRVVGISYNWFERLEDDSRKGWVRSIAVLPEFRGRGLGKALLLASMHALKTAGYETVHLSVDTENQYGALALYMNAGFKVDSRMIVYRRAVDPNS